MDPFLNYLTYFNQIKGDDSGDDNEDDLDKVEKKVHKE